MNLLSKKTEMEYIFNTLNKENWIAIFAAILVIYQLKNAVKTASLTILTNMVTGEFNKLRSSIEDKLNIDILDKKETYQSVHKKLSKKNKKILENCVRDITNHFEMIAISINNGIIKKSICFEYIGLIYTKYYRWCLPFIEQRREKANNPKVLENFTNLAIEWKDKIEGKNLMCRFFINLKLFAKNLFY